MNGDHPAMVRLGGLRCRLNKIIRHGSEGVDGPGMLMYGSVWFGLAVAVRSGQDGDVRNGRARHGKVRHGKVRQL